jgi:hypothetical protein
MSRLPSARLHRLGPPPRPSFSSKTPELEPGIAATGTAADRRRSRHRDRRGRVFLHDPIAALWNYAFAHVPPSIHVDDLQGRVQRMEFLDRPKRGRLAVRPTSTEDQERDVINRCRGDPSGVCQKTSTWVVLIRRISLGHQRPQQQDSGEGHCCDAQKSYRAAQAPGHQA